MDAIGVGCPKFARLSCLSLESKVELPSTKFVQVPHICQLCTWDCGLACVLMVLKALGIEDCDMKLLERLCSTKSIWTVDLAHLLRKFSVNVLYLTETIGANPKYDDEPFYKEHMAEDRKRVNQLFEKAPQAGIQIQWTSISGGELSILILSGNYLAIALVDKYKLGQSWFPYGVNSGYIGHYVVICGYDMDANEFEIRDPASSRKSERVSLECLDEARKSFGTDEDTLLVQKLHTDLHYWLVHDYKTAPIEPVSS